MPACDDYQAALDGYNFRPFSHLVSERERSSVIARTTFDFTDELSGWAMLQYTDITTNSTRAAANSQELSGTLFWHWYDRGVGPGKYGVQSHDDVFSVIVKHADAMNEIEACRTSVRFENEVFEKNFRSM